MEPFVLVPAEASNLQSRTASLLCGLFLGECGDAMIRTSVTGTQVCVCGMVLLQHH